jgi:hypothetical protein
MWFRIYRYDRGGKPCDQAVERPYVFVDVRTTDDPAKVLAYNGHREWWYNKGRNHRKLNGKIARDIDSVDWQIDIISIEQLAKLAKDYGEVHLIDEGPNGIVIQLGST